MARTAGTGVVDPRDALTRRVLQVCDQTGAFIEWWGFKSIQGRVWTLLALRGEPMTQIEVAELLGVSRSLVHGAMTDLEGYGLVDRLGDERRAPWVANVDVWPTITEILREREWMLIESVRLSLEAAIEEADLVYRQTGEQPWRIDRLRLLLSLTEMAQNFMRLVLSLRVANELRGVRELIRMATTIVQGLRRVSPTP